MAEVLLNNIINDTQQLKWVLKWLNDSSHGLEENKDKPDLECTIGEFISFFLNSIHENAQNNAIETPKKIYTPKAIRKLETPESQKPKRRPALFADKSTDEVNDMSPKCITPRDRNRGLLNESTLVNENNCMSPVSPIYTRINCNITPKSHRKISLNERSLCLGDFITKRSSSSKKKGGKNENTEPQESRRLRRINPTNLKFNNTFGKSDNSFNFVNETCSEIVVDNAVEQRNLLAEERMKIVIDEVPTVAVTKKLKHEIVPDLNLTTHRKQLDAVVSLYVYCLDHNLVLNLISELYFIISLILNKQFESDVKRDSEEELVCYDQLFNNIHNSVYFGVRVLEQQARVIGMLDKQTIKLLVNNERLRSISPSMNKVLIEIWETKNEINLPVAEATLNVCFMTETDNRQNFPTDLSFHAFRKQRDLFYEVLRIWETHHLSAGWNFSMALGGKIKSLFSLHMDEANFRHFSRLFKSQLIGVCSKINIENIPEDQLSFLSTIPNINSEKLNRLTSRLVTKASSTNGINTLPTFHGNEEFYRDFILTAALHNFNIHLKDTFICEIVQLSNSNFSCKGLEETEYMVDLETKTSYVSCLRSLRILAKFLGFLETLPYCSPNNINANNVMTSEIEMRNWYRPQFHLEKILEDSLNNGNVLLTIPWVTKYLSMLPASTLRLSYFMNLYDILFKIFYNSDLTNASGLLINLCLGWLFELNHFPSELYYIWCTKYEQKVLTKVEIGLDSSDVVSKDALYICCPYLCEFKRLLLSTCSGKSTITVKHITPVTAAESPAQVSQKKVKLQLEEAFLNTQPVSMRKTVEFVSERVASACVKTVCNVIVPKHKSIALEELKNLAIDIPTTDIDTCEYKEFLAELKAKCDVLLQSKMKELLLACTEEISKQIDEKVEKSVCLLLADEELNQTRNVCSSIAIRMCRDRVQQWINAHLNAGILSKDFDSFMTKFIKKQGISESINKNKCTELLSTGKNHIHNEEAPSAVKIIELIRQLSIDAIETANVKSDQLIDLIEQCIQCIDQRSDVNLSIACLINKMIFDFIIILISKQPEEYTSSVMQVYIDYWKSNNNDEELFKNLICSRNVEILGTETKCWNKLAAFIVALLKSKLLECENFEAQYLAIYNQDWDSKTLKCLSGCLQEIATQTSKFSDCNARFTYLLNFVSDFCSDIDQDIF